MVADNLALNRFYEEKPIENPLSPTPLQYTSVSLSEVQYNKLRLEASAFNLNAKAAKSKVAHCLYGYVHLWGDDGLVKEASYPGRFKRIYTETNKGIPFFLPSQLTEINPKPTKFISEKTCKNINDLQIKPNTLLLSRSGTIGKCSIASKTNIGKVYSDDVIRVSFYSVIDLGYTYAFFSTAIGQQILQTNNYGAVIQHIEPEHLKNIIIPDAPESIKQNIHELIITSYNLRDQSNDLIERAEKILYQELQLPPIEELKPTYFDKTVDLRNYTTRLSSLDLRLDPSFHIPKTRAIVELIKKTSKFVTTIGNKEIAKQIIIVGRFKRTYVDSKNGIPFFGGKQLLELNPSNVKYLSKDQHNSIINEKLFLKENMIAVTCSGTIGKVNIIPKHWENWTLNQHVMRIIPVNHNLAGYIYCWLNTDYGYNLIIRHTYGSVVDEIDDKHLSKVEIPLLKNELKQQEINNMVLQANDLRYQAYLKEQEAIKMMEDVIEGKALRFY